MLFGETVEPNQLTLFGETAAAYCENHTEHRDATVWVECKVLVC
jgi:hypothetical protein